jgi:hypothetical protein
MADRLNVTDLDFDQIKANLKAFLKQQSEFQDYDFEGSGLSILLDVLAYNTHYNAYYLNMVANESFLDTAMLRNSVVSHAKRFGYTPHSVTSPSAIVNVTVDSGNNTPGILTIPKGYTFLSDQIDNRAYNFVTTSDVTVGKTANNYVFSNVLIHEGQFVSYDYNYDQSSNPKQIFTIPDSTIDTGTLVVSVRQSSSNSDSSVYTQSTDVLQVTGISEIYFLQEGQDGQYEIYFGEDIVGKSIPDGAIVTLTYVTSNGTEANKANSFIATASISGLTNIAVDSVVPAIGGSIKETVDQIKYAAPLQFLSQNRAVTTNDYVRLIQEKYPSFEAVNVWGGEDNDPPVYGKIFIAAKPALGFEITDTEKDYVINNILKPISILTVTPTFVDVDYNYLKAEAEVFYDPSQTTLSELDMQSSVRTIIEQWASSTLNEFNSYVKYSSLESSISNFSKSIVSNEVEFMLGKKFRPSLINSQSYILDFGVELKRGTTYDNFYSTPTFGVLDGEGVTRNCFFEEIPSSFTGLEGVTVTNPGYNYTSTPTITIVGDGAGATAVATIVNGKISKITVTNPGTGYTSAVVQITGGNGLLGEGQSVLEGRYGQIRMSYYKLDATSSQNVKVIMNSNLNGGVMGTIDYVLGKITLTGFNPISVENDFGDIMIFMRPKSNVIQSKLNKMVVLDTEDLNVIVVKTIKTS